MSLWDDIDLAEEITVNKYIDNLEEGMELITTLLSVNMEDNDLEKKLDHLTKLIEVDYLDLASKVNLPNEAQTYMKIMQAKNTIEEMIKFPFLTKKKIVAIGGGFSSGKSRFINSILSEDILPTDTRPTTSIATYIAKGSFTKIFAFNIFGTKSKTDREALKAISHAFSEKYNLSFTQILKNIILQSEKMPFSNIAFLDTPGYTKSDAYKREDNTDENMAKKHLQVADTLLWAIDVERGTIPFQDLEFIKKLNFSKPIFFIFNKADKKDQSEINNIMEVAREDILGAGLDIADIVAYSSVEPDEYGKEAILEFLNHMDKEDKKVNVSEEFDLVFQSYMDHLDRTTKAEKKKLEIYNRIAILNEIEKEKASVRKIIQDSKDLIKKQMELMEAFKELSKKFKDTIDEILQEIDNNHLTDIQRSIIASGYEMIEKTIVDEIEKIKEELIRKCEDTKESFDLSPLQREIEQYAVTVEETEERVQLTHRCNEFMSWIKYRNVKKPVYDVQSTKVSYIDSQDVTAHIFNTLANLKDQLNISINKDRNIKIYFEDILDKIDDPETKADVENILLDFIEQLESIVTTHLESISIDYGDLEDHMVPITQKDKIMENEFHLLDIYIRAHGNQAIDHMVKIIESSIKTMYKEINGLIRRCSRG